MINTEVQQENKTTILFIIVAVVLTTFLFTIDEGNYNFKWMTNIGSWIVFAIYSLFIFIFELFFGWLFKKINIKKKPVLFSITAGTFTALVTLFLIFKN